MLGIFERVRERRAKRIELTLDVAKRLGLVTEEREAKVRAMLAKYRAGEIDWEEFFKFLIEYLPQIIAIFMAIFA